MGIFDFFKKGNPDSRHANQVKPSAHADFKRYFDLSEKINDNRFSIQQRLAFCEESLDILPAVVSEFISGDGELPPVIYCRDCGPEFYMRLGQWDDARRMIGALIDCHAYYPHDGSDELEYFKKYKSTAETAVSFLSENPGFIQKNIYRALSGTVDNECLKHFIRCSLQIRKEADGKSNRLYLASR